MNSVRIRIELDLKVCGNEYDDYESFVRSIYYKFEQICREHPHSVFIQDYRISIERPHNAI